MTEFNAMISALVSFDRDRLIGLVEQALAEGVPDREILNKGLIAGMDLIGKKMGSGTLFIPEVLMAAHAMAGCVEILKPRLCEHRTPVQGVVVIGSVKGDIHDIGKNLVAIMMESSGLDVHNLGVDVAPEQFVDEIKRRHAGMVCLSSLLTTTMPAMKLTIEAIEAAGLRDEVRVMVGGAPVTQAFADQIGADGFAADAAAASRLAKSLIKQPREQKVIV